MNMDSGFASGGISFEYTVAEKKTPQLMLKKVALIIGYILWALLLFVVGSASKLFVPLMALIPISLWILVYFTWRYTQVRYEYSFFAGDLTVSRILNDRFRKTLVKVHIRNIAAILPYEDEYTPKAEAFGAEKIIFAASGYDAPTLYVAMWKDEDSGKKLLLCFEPDEKCIKILRYYNASAMTLRK
jgi:hypothetical protein